MAIFFCQSKILYRADIASTFNNVLHAGESGFQHLNVATIDEDIIDVCIIGLTSGGSRVAFQWYDRMNEPLTKVFPPGLSDF